MQLPRASRYTEKMLSDETPMYVVLGLLLIYVLLFAEYKFHAIYTIPLDFNALVILIPILITDVFKTAWESLSKKNIPEAQENLSEVAVIIPSHNGAKTLRSTLKSLLKKFNKNALIVSSNGSTDATIKIAKEMKVRFIDIPEAVGKVEAINLALKMVKKKYTLIMDDDTLIGDAVVPTNLLDQGYHGVAFRVLPVKNNLLSELQTHEYRKAMDISRGFHNESGTVQTISGAIGLFHTVELQRQIELHTGEFSGEDLQRTLLIHLAEKSKGVVIANSTVETVVPETLWALFKQRIFGWNPGFYSNMAIYFKILIKKNVPFRLRFEAFHTIFLIMVLDPIRILSLPILIFSPAFLLIFYVTYVFLDAIPYAVMGTKERFWVVLVAPFYGLFNFITRFAAGAVFVYRRIAYKFGKVLKFDEYRIVRKKVRLVSISLTVYIYFTIFTLYSYAIIIPNELRESIDYSIYSSVVNDSTSSILHNTMIFLQIIERR